MWPFRKRAREPNTGIPAIPVEFNCPASWGNMNGSDQIRHCTHCDRKVYNLSNMTSFEARSLMLREERSLCVRYYLRDDGMIWTFSVSVHPLPALPHSQERGPARQAELGLGGLPVA